MTIELKPFVTFVCPVMAKSSKLPDFCTFACLVNPVHIPMKYL